MNYKCKIATGVVLMVQLAVLVVFGMIDKPSNLEVLVGIGIVSTVAMQGLNIVLGGNDD